MRPVLLEMSEVAKSVFGVLNKMGQIQIFPTASYVMTAAIASAACTYDVGGQTLSVNDTVIEECGFGFSGSSNIGTCAPDGGIGTIFL